MEEIKKGDHVVWTHSKSISYGGGTFQAEGIVEKIFTSSVGGKRNFVKVARIKLLPDKYWKEIKRNTTTIKVDKLTKV